MVPSLRVACACIGGLILVACGGPRSGPTEPAPKPAAGSLASTDANDPCAVVPGGDGGAGSPSQLIVLVRAPGNVGALALDDEWVYWIDGTHGLARTSKRAGGAVSSLTSMGAGAACCGVLAVDAAHVYWAIDPEGGPKGLRRTSKAPPPVPAENKADVPVDPSSPACLAADADAVYWLRLKRSDDWAWGGSIVRASKSGGAQKILALIETPGFGCITVDSSNLYLAAVNEHRGEAAVRSVPKTGGPEKTIASMVGPGVFLQVDDENVYWADAGGIVRARKTGGARSVLTEKPRRSRSTTTSSTGRAEEVGARHSRTAVSSGSPSRWQLLLQSRRYRAGSSAARTSLLPAAPRLPRGARQSTCVTSCGPTWAAALARSDGRSSARRLQWRCPLSRHQAGRSADSMNSG